MMEHTVSEPMLARIGDITVSFAMLESEIQMFVGSLLLEHQRIGQIITAEVSFSGLRALALSLYRERHGDDDADVEVLRGLMKRAAEIEHQRNQITHSTWAGSQAGVIRIKMTAKERHGIRFDFAELTGDELAAIATAARELAGEVQELMFRLMTEGKVLNNPIAPIWGPHGTLM